MEKYKNLFLIFILLLNIHAVLAQEIVPAENHHEEFKYIHKIRLTTLASYMTVEGEQLSNGSKGMLNSSLYPAFKLDYTLKSSQWLFTFIVGHKTISFKDSPDHIVMDRKHNLYRVDVMALKRFGSFAIGLGAGIEDKFFYKIVNSSLADAETSNDKKFYLNLDQELFKHEKDKLSLGLKGGFNPKEDAGAYAIQAGYFYSASMKFDHALSLQNSAGLELFFKNENYKTQSLKIHDSEIGLGVSFSYDWGSGK